MKLPVRSVKDLVQHCNTAAVPCSWGSGQQLSYLYGKRLFAVSGIVKEMTHVPYKGTAPVVTDLLGGHITVGITSIAAPLAGHQSGALRILAVNAEARSPQTPDVPTFREAGLNVPELLKHVAQHRTVAGFAGAEVIANDQFWDVECDILIPAALEAQITKANAGRLKARMVIEGANGPTTPEADELLKSRGIFNIPDFLCNAGGVTTSYFEQVQNDMNYYWTKDAVLERLDTKMTMAFNAVLETAEKENVYMRDAAYMVAIGRVVKAMELRGWI